MAEVTIEIGGRSYRIGCGEGEQAHVRELAAMIDGEARKIEGDAGTIPEGRLLVMSALLLADRLEDAAREKTELLARLAEAEAGGGGSETQSTADEIERFAARLSAAAEALSPAGHGR
ncbi:MAG: cell division protein ZapA [Pseudomonadota bacterium]